MEQVIKVRGKIERGRLGGGDAELSGAFSVQRPLAALRGKGATKKGEKK